MRTAADTAAAPTKVRRVLNTLLMGLGSLVASLLGLRQYSRGDPRRLAHALQVGAAAAAALAALAAALSGRAILALPLAGVAWALYTGWLPLGAGAGKATLPAGQGGNSTSVRTAFLEMTLDHRRRAVSGRVLAGAFAGKDLAALSQPQLATLYAECRAGEPQSRVVLEAYLDRAWPQWRQEMMAGATASRDGASAKSSASGRMERKEALEVLGLAAGADEEAIRTAHRNLMKRFHPDQGGSTWLAARINEAKDVLLGK